MTGEAALINKNKVQDCLPVLEDPTSWQPSSLGTNRRVASATQCRHHFCGSTVRESWSGSTGRSLAQPTECGSRFRFRGQIALVISNVRRGFLRVLRRTLESTFASLGVL